MTNARLREWMRPAGQPPRLTWRGRLFDVVFALVLAAMAVHYTLDNLLGLISPPRRVSPLAPGDWIPLIAVGLAGTVPLMFRRRYPLAVLWLVLAAILVTPPDTPRLTFYAGVVAAYSAAAYSPYRMPTLASLAVLVLVVDVVTDDTPVPTVPTQYVPLLVVFLAVGAAYGVRSWRVRTDESRSRLSTVERERADAVRRAAELERTRIARELHDVVTHNVSMMVIQAGAARKVMDASPEQAREALLAVEAAGRAAMAELRHVMGLLAADGTATAELAPQPGLDQVAALVGRVRETGLPVELTVAGEPRPLASGVELAAYRVVQEALTNTVKHATGAKATVTVDYGADRLKVEVTDTGGDAAAAVTGAGRGLIGLRERLALYGGTLRSGPRAHEGYRVTALIPLEAL
ncbi:sensor histidine kinase [Amycolatopsis xylanica]|uniref:sensor histidine kinase n=1 Tax=Amycolatopsis xylanica TaxID=589385 RepID=UPI001FE18F01|nr:histidine kinase [Amycolatopsis xylanica]